MVDPNEDGETSEEEIKNAEEEYYYNTAAQVQIWISGYQMFTGLLVFSIALTYWILPYIPVIKTWVMAD